MRTRWRKCRKRSEIVTKNEVGKEENYGNGVGVSKPITHLSLLSGESENEASRGESKIDWPNERPIRRMKRQRKNKKRETATISFISLTWLISDSLCHRHFNNLIFHFRVRPIWFV